MFFLCITFLPDRPVRTFIFSESILNLVDTREDNFLIFFVVSLITGKTENIYVKTNFCYFFVVVYSVINNRSDRKNCLVFSMGLQQNQTQ